jgi:valyl-tRNA synthetase
MAGYDPKEFEEKWYRRWTEADAFAPKPAEDGESTFSIVIPPPNVTGSLHMGHALNNTLQDVLVRYHRMLGDATLWVPGMDHAGIATQNVVERQLMAEGTDRHELGREAFVERTWRWKEESGGTISGQLRRLGVSCDWNRERFTMDEGLSDAVREVFVSLFEGGLIRRDRYLINWCPRCRTALSDIEVEHEDQPGHLWHLRYPLEDGSGSISVATTRPETMLGDTAVAVHPEDERYKDLIGRNVVLPIVGRKIAIIADTYVDSSFGSGAVKITPGHDPNDFDMGLRHSLEMISVMNEDGTMSAEAGEYEGQTVAECRKALVERFEKEGVLERTDDHAHSVGTCYRCHNVIEPLLSLQWFLNVQDMADRTLEAFDEGKTRFVPAHWEKTYRTWIENIRPWCISRQLWWGHRIPAWYCQDCSEVVVAREDPDSCPSCKGALVQDEDVLDTWFSSGLWPFSTMGWPENTEDLKRFYPTSTLVTGFDIIFFWVARMMMMGLRFMDEVPFQDIYIHALVRDEHGQKMSKSKGNVIDPVGMIDEFGADALRFTLVAFAAMGRDVRLSPDRIVGYRNFVNKLWNASRFVAIKREDTDVDCAMPAELKSVANRWIRSRLASAIVDTRAALEAYRFNDAAQRLYQFTWHEFCDWYIELTKADQAEGEAGEAARLETAATLNGVLEHLLRLLHPIIPFVTEELWQELPAGGRADGFLMHAAYPEVKADWVDDRADHEIGIVIECVRAVRNIRSEMNVTPKTELDVHVAPGPVAEVLEANRELVGRLGRIRQIVVGTEVPEGASTAVIEGTELAVPLEDLIDVAAETDRLEKAAAKAQSEINRIDKKLSNASFIDRAPAEVVAGEREKRAGYVADQDALKIALDRMVAMKGAS